MTLSKTYWIKCDNCKTEIGQTDSLHESACGGRCVSCKEKDRVFLGEVNK